MRILPMPSLLGTSALSEPAAGFSLGAAVLSNQLARVEALLPKLKAPDGGSTGTTQHFALPI